MRFKVGDYVTVKTESPSKAVIRDVHPNSYTVNFYPYKEDSPWALLGEDWLELDRSTIIYNIIQEL